MQSLSIYLCVCEVATIIRRSINTEQRTETPKYISKFKKRRQVTNKKDNAKNNYHHKLTTQNTQLNRAISQIDTSFKLAKENQGRTNATLNTGQNNQPRTPPYAQAQ